MVRGRAVLFGLAVATACQPNLDDTVSVVTTTRVLAIQSVPAEAPPMSSVRYTALVAQGSGPDGGAPRLVWDYCNARNPLSNLGPVNTLCVHPGSSLLTPIGVGIQVSGGVPDLACGSFGPNAPPAMDGGLPGQPVSPDSTGGYYQPVSVFLEQGGVADTLYFMRLSCGFSGANEASQGILSARYHTNTNPEVASLAADGAPLVDNAKGATNRIAAGKKVTLEVAWPVCPLVDKCGDGVCGADESAMSCPSDCTHPRGCGGAERYVNFDLATQSVVDQREGIHVSWYASAGRFDQDRTGNAGSDDATTSDDGWAPPTQATTVDLWVVLRDDRGGIGWAEYVLDVK
jgi:hypothetical protein